MICTTLSILAAVAVQAGTPTWDKGMDDNAGQAAISEVDVFTLPGADEDNTGAFIPYEIVLL